MKKKIIIIIGASSLMLAFALIFLAGYLDYIDVAQDYWWGIPAYITISILITGLFIVGIGMLIIELPGKIKKDRAEKEKK